MTETAYRTASQADDGPLDLDRLRSTPVTADPFPHLIVPGFLKADALPSINADYPKIDKPGSFPVGELRYGPAFARLIAALHGPAMTSAFATAFSVDLSDRPTMITVRGQCRAKDGRIHTDNKNKIITVLIYMNAGWEADAGRLRLLRSADDIEDVVTEVPPAEGTMLAFLNTRNAYHGHKQFVGERRAIQLNWMSTRSVVAREQARHSFVARLKRLKLPF